MYMEDAAGVGPDGGSELETGGEGEERVERVERVGALVAALRSGKFPQTRGALQRTELSRYSHNPVGFCCLGVACEVAIAGGLELARDDRQGTMFYGSGGDASNNVLPEPVHQWFGFADENPWLAVPPQVLEQTETGELSGLSNTHDDMYAAAELNDEAELTLVQLADCFEFTFLREQWEAGHGQVDA